MLSVHTTDSGVREIHISHQPTQIIKQMKIKALIEHKINTLFKVHSM